MQPEPEAQESLKPSEHRRSLKGQPKESSTWQSEVLLPPPVWFITIFLNWKPKPSVPLYKLTTRLNTLVSWRDSLAQMSWCTGSESQLSRSLAHCLSPSPAASESPVPWGILADSQPGCRWRSGSVYSGGDWIKTRAAQWQDKQPPPGRVNSPKAGLGCVNQSPSRLTSFRITDPLGGLQQTVSINSSKNKKNLMPQAHANACPKDPAAAGSTRFCCHWPRSIEPEVPGLQGRNPVTIKQQPALSLDWPSPGKTGSRRHNPNCQTVAVFHIKIHK